MAILQLLEDILGGRSAMMLNFNIRRFLQQWETPNFDESVVQRRLANGETASYLARDELLILAFNLIIMREHLK